MTHNAAITDKPPRQLKTTGEEEDDIQTDAWENTYHLLSIIENIETEQQAMSSPPSHEYNWSTSQDGSIQVIHFISKTIPEIREWMKAWDDKAFPFDPLSYGSSTWFEGDYQHPYGLGSAKTITMI